MDRFASERDEMVLRQLQNRDIRDERVLAAMRKVPRHLFVPADQRANAYWDGPLPIGFGQTISQPYIVALMAEAMKLTDSSKCLDIGTGSGYAAAVLAELSGQVVSIERIPELAEIARGNLNDAGYPDVEVLCTDGSLGYAQEAPYDAIAVAAGAPAVPETLKRQLKIGGRLVIPVGRSHRFQDLIRIRRTAEDEFQTDNLGGVAFVPLLGAEAWENDPFTDQ